MKSISLRSTLLGDVVSFLADEQMSCVHTQEGIVELISQLANYKEEGRELFPEIFIIDDLDVALKVLSPCSWHKIGSGNKSPQTMLKALKKCAPLTEGGWSIIIHRKEDDFDFGVCQTGTHSLSVSISESLIDDKNPDLKAIYIHQVAERLIEVRGMLAAPLMISFSSQQRAESPIHLQNKFSEKIVSKVPDKFKEQALRFFNIILLEALQKGHGTLACIIDSNKRVMPKKLTDGHILDKRINISEIIEELIEGQTLATNRKLEGCIALIMGMMNSDGITVFTNSGEVVAYNIFVKHSKRSLLGQTSGGARSRTFLTLCGYIGNGVEGVYIQSQDGEIKVNIKGDE